MSISRVNLDKITKIRYYVSPTQKGGDTMDQIIEKTIVTGKDGVDYDLTPYQNPADIAGYLGFLDTNGNFYRVRKITDPEHERPHNSWAKNFIEYYGLEKGENLTSSTTLVQNCGFMLSSYQNGEGWLKEGRTYITTQHLGVCDEAACEIFVTNERQLNKIREIRDFESFKGKTLRR